MDRIRVLPPEQVHMESFPFTNEKIIELIPDSKTKDIVERASLQDPSATRIVDSMPDDVVEAIREAGTSDSTQTLMKDLLSTTWRGRNPNTNPEDTLCLNGVFASLSIGIS